MKFVSRVRFQRWGVISQKCVKSQEQEPEGRRDFHFEKPWKHTLGTLGREINPPCEITPGGCEITAPCEITPPPAKSRPSCPQTPKWHDRVTVTLTPAPPGRPLRSAHCGRAGAREAGSRRPARGGGAVSFTAVSAVVCTWLIRSDAMLSCTEDSRQI